MRCRWDLDEKDVLLDNDDDIVPYEVTVHLTGTGGTRRKTKAELRALVDGGANISLCSKEFARMLQDIVDIPPIPLVVAVKGGEQLSITRRGYFPIQLACGRTI